MSIARLHLITPDATGASVLARTRAAIDAGAPWVQVRTKSGSDRDRMAFAGAVVDAAAGHPTTVIIDDRIDLALAVGAAGVHVGADDLPVGTARRILGPDAIVGATCRTPDDARSAIDAGASYLGVGPVYPTSTKVGLPDPIGLAGLEAVATVAADRSEPVPVIAISGITANRLAEVLGAGAYGVAVVAAIFDAVDAGAETRRFLDALPAAAPGASAIAAMRAVVR